jgi:hypothetical protein
VRYHERFPVSGARVDDGSDRLEPGLLERPERAAIPRVGSRHADIHRTRSEDDLADKRRDHAGTEPPSHEIGIADEEIEAGPVVDADGREISASKGELPFAPTSHLPGASPSPPPFRNEFFAGAR